MKRLREYEYLYEYYFDVYRIKDMIITPEQQHKLLLEELNFITPKQEELMILTPSNKYINIKKKVLCIETNIVYESMKQVYLYTGIDVGSISNCCKGKRATAGGYHWKYYNEC